MKTEIKWLSLLLAAALLLGCTACGRQAVDPYDALPPSTGGEDVARSAAVDNLFSLNSNSRYSFDPYVATNHSNQLICCLVYENMVDIDDNFNVIKNLITSWEPNEDCTLWTFKVATGHTFHDGSEVTPKDLSYSIGRAIYSDRYAGRFSSFKGASYTGDTLQVSLGVGGSQFVKLLNIPVVKAGTAGQTDTRPIGSGPYTYNEDYTELLAYDGYTGSDRLPVDRIGIKEYSSAESIISAFEDGSIDVVVNDPSSYTNLGYASTNETHTFATTNMHYVAFNEQSTMGRFAYFRVAMQYAFDRDYLVELLQGNGVATPIPMVPSVEDYPEVLADSLHYDLDTCRAILENAGIRDYDGDGQLEYMSGSPQDININFIVTSDSTAKSGVVHRFAQDMEEIGIPVTVKELTWDDYMDALEKGEFDMYYGEVKLRNNFDLTELLQVHDDSHDDEEGYRRPDINYTGSTDAAAEQYVKSYLAAPDKASRATAYYQLCEYLTGSTGSLITIGFERQQIITHRGVVIGVDANAGNPLYNFQNWTILLGDEELDFEARQEAVERAAAARQVGEEEDEEGEEGEGEDPDGAAPEPGGGEAPA